MRILSWNCNGGFRNKFALLDAFSADVLVIQECEEPTAAHADYYAWAGKYHWLGAHKNKGIGIFVKGGHSATRLDWPDDDAALFLPVQINAHIQLIGVWTQAVKAAGASYVGQLGKYLELNRERLNAATILCGDFNANTILDKPRGQWSHSRCVAQLAELGIVSLYHRLHIEEHGTETQPTFFMYRHESKPFHLDYAFAHESLLSTAPPNFHIGAPAHWLQYSDHMPLVFDI
jgi:exonuclease III